MIIAAMIRLEIALGDTLSMIQSFGHALFQDLTFSNGPIG